MKKNQSRITKITISFLLIFLLLGSTLISAENATEEETGRSAKAHLSIQETIPAVRVNEWSSFNATLIDDYDFNWDQFKDQPYWVTHIYWRFLFGIPDIGRILGYTTIKIDADVVDQDYNPVEGWGAQVEPSSITGTTQGRKWPIKISATTFRAGVEYAVFIRLKLTRFDAWGDLDASSYLYIPIKASSYNDIEMISKTTTKRAAPKSIAVFDIEFKNNGYYQDVFNFMVEGDGEVVGHFDSQALFIKPGETRNAKLYIMTPGSAYDAGTPHRLEIYTYSRLNQTKTYVGTVNLITEGSHVSPLFLLVFAVIVIIILIVIFVFYKNKVVSLFVKNKVKEEKTSEKSKEAKVKKAKKKDSKKQKAMDKIKSEKKK